MADPAATTTTALAKTAVKSGASGTTLAAALPIDLITMGVGLVAALWALLHIPPDPAAVRTPLHVFAVVALGGFMAGVFVPIVVAGGINYLPWLAGVAPRPLELAAAAAIGAAPHLLPYLWRLYRQVKRGEA